jgi:hypothetical protein
MEWGYPAHGTSARRQVWVKCKAIGRLSCRVHITGKRQSSPRGGRELDRQPVGRLRPGGDLGGEAGMF